MVSERWASIHHRVSLAMTTRYRGSSSNSALVLLQLPESRVGVKTSGSAIHHRRCPASAALQVPHGVEPSLPPRQTAW
jgi:hypothetical protein